MISPHPLVKGSKIGIIATARKISEEEVKPAILKLKEWDYEAIPGKHLFESHHQFAGEDKKRLEDLQEMLDNPEIKAILCARGGYGTVRIIDS